MIAKPYCALWFLAGMGKYIITQESFYLQGDILRDINEQDTSFLDCKYKHMMKSGAPRYKVGVLHLVLHIKYHGFTSRIDFKGLSLFGSWSYLNLFREVWAILRGIWFL